MKNIVDRTWIRCHLVGDDKMTSNTHDVMFKDYKNFEDLPGPCKSAEVKKNFKGFWRQMKKGKVK